MQLLTFTLASVISSAPQGPSSLLVDPDPLAKLSRWAGGARVDEAARSRDRERWLKQLAAEESSFAALLVDLAERQQPVVLTTVADRRHRAVIQAVAPDFCALRTDQGQYLLVTNGAISSVRPEARTAALSGDRAVGLELTLGDVLGRLVADRTWVLVTVFGSNETVRGELTSVGLDVATLRLDGAPRSFAYLRLPAIAEVVVEAR